MLAQLSVHNNVYICIMFFLELIVMSVPMRNRVGIQDVLGDVLKELAQGIPLTIAELSRRVGADRRTITKVLEMINQIQNSLEGRELVRVKRGNSWIFKFIEEKTKKAISKAMSLKRKKD